MGENKRSLKLKNKGKFADKRTVIIQRIEFKGTKIIIKRLVKVKGGKSLVQDNSNSKNTKKASKADGVTQPLMSTGTTEPSFDWVPNETNTTTEPIIGNTVVGEKESKNK